MTLKNVLGFGALAMACCSIACAEADDGLANKIQPDAETLVPGDAGSDSGADTGKGGSKPPADSGASCATGATETRACGACGTQTRFCMPDLQWTSWAECTGEKTGSECVVGEKRTVDCGNCGKQTDTCDPKACTWTTGYCSGEGECAPGDTAQTNASCSDPTELRTRTCDDKCAWSSYSACAAKTGWLPMATATIAGRNFHTAVWTGTRMIVWGGASSSSTLKNDGASYDVVSNTWAPIAPSPLSARRQQNAVWTGSKLFIWGGYDKSVALKTGALYDPASDSWTTIPEGPLSARHSSAIVYSAATKQVLVWGGCTSGYCTAAAADGAAYDLETNTWSMIPAGPLTARTDAAYGLIKGELVIWGGRSSTTSMLVDGARFDPVARTWVKFSDPTSTTLDGRYDQAFLVAHDSLVVWGGRSTDDASTAKGNGAIYRPMVGWNAIPAPADALFSPSPKRFDVAAWYGKGKLFVYSGIPSTAYDLPYTGFVSYDVESGTWKSEDLTGVTGYRARATAVWTGKEAIIWGGANGNISGTFYNTGAIHRP